MRGRAMTHWHLRVAVWASVLAICVFAAASVRPPPPVDTAMVERAVSGAEWLAERAAADPERAARAQGSDDLVEWLLVASGAVGEDYSIFAAHLARIGYDDPLFSVQVWLEEIERVLAAADAEARAGSIRTVKEIETELQSLPSIPLDDQDREVRERLLVENMLAAVPEEARSAAAAASGRLSALRAQAGLEDGQ